MLSPAIVTALTAFHIGLGFAVFFAAIGFFVWHDYKKVCRRTEARRRPVEAKPAAEEDWTWPERKVGPESRTHLGRRAA